MRDQLYHDLLLEHWKSPQNYGVLKNADIDIKLDNPYCGDKIHLTLKISKGLIRDIAFTGEGCVISKATASLFTEELKNKSLRDAREINPRNVLDLIGIQLTYSRIKCALLVYNALGRGLKRFKEST